MLTSSVSSSGGGLFSAVSGLSVALVERAVAVTVFGGRDKFTTRDLSYWGQTKVRAQSVLGPSTFGYQPRLSKSVVDENLDVLHQHGLWNYSSLVTKDWAARGGVSVVSPHGMLDSWALRNSAWKKRAGFMLFEKENLVKAGCLHALNDAELRSIRNLGLENRVAVIPNGVEVPKLGPIVRPRFLGDDGRRVLLFLGRIHPKKGVREAILAWAKAVGDCPSLSEDWTFVIAGWDDGGHVSGLKDLSQELGVSSSVHFPGAVYGEDKRSLLQCASCFILPSYSEGLPMSVLEAWSYMLPVLMTSECNLGEAFRLGAAIEIVNEVDSLAASLIGTLVLDTLPQVGKAGYELVCRRFNWETVVDDWLLVYGWLRGLNERPSCVH